MIAFTQLCSRSALQFLQNVTVWPDFLNRRPGSNTDDGEFFGFKRRRFPQLWSVKSYAPCRPLLIPTEVIKLIEYRTDLLSVLGSWINVPQGVEQRGIFGTQFALQFIYLLGQLF